MGYWDRFLLSQPLFNTCGSTWIARTHHASVVYDYSFAIDDEVMWKAVYIKLVVHFVDIVVILQIISQEVLNAVYMHLVLLENFL